MFSEKCPEPTVCPTYSNVIHLTAPEPKVVQKQKQCTTLTKIVTGVAVLAVVAFLWMGIALSGMVVRQGQFIDMYQAAIQEGQGQTPFGFTTKPPFGFTTEPRFGFTKPPFGFTKPPFGFTTKPPFGFTKPPFGFTTKPPFGFTRPPWTPRQAPRSTPYYRVTGWTEWLNDNRTTETGNQERLSDYNKPCGYNSPTRIQARDVASPNTIISSTKYIDVGPDYGLVCKNSNQYHSMCVDYRVQYRVPRISPWYSRDLPSATGDWELRKLQKGWTSGKFIAWRADSQNYGVTDRRLKLGPRYGLLCLNDGNTGLCHDYEVRFYCQ